MKKTSSHGILMGFRSNPRPWFFSKRSPNARLMANSPGDGSPGWEIPCCFWVCCRFQLNGRSFQKEAYFNLKLFSASSKLEGVFSSSKQVLSNKKWNAPYIPSPKPATRPIVTKPPETVVEFVVSEWDRRHLAACLLKASLFGSHTGTSRNYCIWMYVICM